MTVGHARVSPALWESLKLIELVGNKATEAAVGTFDNMLEATGAGAAFSCENGATRLIG